MLLTLLENVLLQEDRRTKGFRERSYPTDSAVLGGWGLKRRSHPGPMTPEAGRVAVA